MSGQISDRTRFVLPEDFKALLRLKPSPVYSKGLRLNIALNNLTNVHVEEVALSDTDGVMPLYIRGGATSLYPSHYDLKYEKAISVKVA